MKRILFFLIFLLPVAGYASKLDIYLMGGPGFSRISRDDYVRMNPYMVNEYDTGGNSEVRPLIGLGIAHTFVMATQPVSVALGLSAYYLNLGNVQGTEYPFINDGLFDSLDYQFQARSFTTMLESRFIYTRSDWQPYLIAGVGVAWNHLYGYSETPTDPAGTAAASPETFADHTQTAFAYELGIGLQKQIYVDTKQQFHYFLSVDYRYLNVGAAELGLSPAQTSNSRLQLSRLSTQALMFSLKISV